MPSDHEIRQMLSGRAPAIDSKTRSRLRSIAIRSTR